MAAMAEELPIQVIHLMMTISYTKIHLWEMMLLHGTALALVKLQTENMEKTRAPPMLLQMVLVVVANRLRLMHILDIRPLRSLQHTEVSLITKPHLPIGN